MLPVSLRLVYVLNEVTAQASNLALLSIVNTRVGIPTKYLPAYGAISFLPYSLRPIFAWICSLLLNSPTKINRSEDRHDKLLFPAFLLASLSFVGTVFIPSGGIILCFFWGFVRGIAGAWVDFLIGMTVIELSKLQLRFSPSRSEGGTTYERIVSVNTAQSSVAKSIGSFLASIMMFVFFAKTERLGETVANTLLLGTAVIFLFASLASLNFQAHLSNLLANLNEHGSTPFDGMDGAASISSPNDMSYTSSSLQQSSEQTQCDDLENTLLLTLLPENEHTTEQKRNNQSRIVEVSTLVAFQILLAVSALQKPIIAVSNQTTWILLVTAFVSIIIITLFLGHRYECQPMINPFASEEDDRKLRSQTHRVPHKQLNLYFLLRYSLPIAAFLMDSYLYSVLESEPIFLQLISVLKTVIGSVATFCYEKFLSPYCHSGWPFIGLIASLDIIMGFVALLDVWVIHMVKEKEIDGEYFVDDPLRYLVSTVGLVKYFFAELDYMPALVLSATNVYSNSDVLVEYEDDDVNPISVANNDIDEQLVERASLSGGIVRQNISALSVDLNNEENCNLSRSIIEGAIPKLPVISVGMQYASFLSCIDFGAQVGDWITIPIVASLDITRENHWDHLDKFVIITSVLRMSRVVFLWLIFPPIIQKDKATNYDHNNYGDLNEENE